MEFKILSDEQLIEILYLKDDLLHAYGEMLFSKGINYQVFKKLKQRLEILDKAINDYVQKSENCFQIACLERAFIEPQEKSELKTNVLGYHLKDTEVVFDGTIDSGGYLTLSLEDKDWGTNIIAKNVILKDKNIGSKESGYHYIKSIIFYEPGTYMIEKDTPLGIGISENKELVKSIKDSRYRF